MKFVWIRIPFASSLLLIPAHLARCYYLAWYAKECTACLQNQRYNRREFRRGWCSAPLSVASALCSNFHIQREDSLASKCDSKKLEVETFISAEFHNFNLLLTLDTTWKLSHFFIELMLFANKDYVCISICLYFDSSSVAVANAQKFDSTTFGGVVSNKELLWKQYSKWDGIKFSNVSKE